MKYVLMFTSRPDLDAAVDPEHAQAVYKQVYEWFQENERRAGSPTAAPSCTRSTTATTVKYGDDGPVVVDGPFNEAKEVIGGFSVIEVPDMDAAIAHGQDLAAARAPRRRPRDPADGRGLLASSSERPSDRRPTGSSRRRCARSPGLLVARLSRRFGDFDLAEEAVQQARRRGAHRLAPRRPAGPARGLAPGRGAAQRARRRTPRAARQRGAGRPAPSHPAIGARRHRRPAGAALRLLPPGAWRPRRGWR